MYHSLHKNIQQQFSTLLLEQQIGILISEGSCDTEGWSNDAENSTLHHRNILHLIHSKNNYFEW